MQPALHRYRLAAALGLGGLVPFIALAGWSAAVPASRDAVNALLNYAACIASFVGAVHWGIALHACESPSRQRFRYGWSVVPALLAWGVLALPDVGARLVGMAGVLGASLAVDVCLWRRHALAGGYVALRCGLTAVACLSLLAATLSTTA